MTDSGTEQQTEKGRARGNGREILRTPTDIGTVAQTDTQTNRQGQGDCDIQKRQRGPLIFLKMNG